MEFKINEISYDDKKDLFSIKIDKEKFYLSYEELEEYKLSPESVLSADEYSDISKLSNKNLGISLALYYISNRLISSHKLRDYLWRKDIDSEAIDIIVEELEANGILDDDNYITYYIKDKKNINLRSKGRIAMDLRSMGFDSEKISIFMEDYEDNDEIEVISKLVERKNFLGRKTREQIFSYLGRNMFKVDNIKAYIDSMED